MSEEQAISLLREVAAELGVAFDNLWRIMVQQAYVSAVTDIVLGIFFIALGVALLVAARKLLVAFKDSANGQRWFYGEDGLLMAAIFSGLFGTLFVILTPPLVVHNIVTALFNPEYWALREIVKLMSQLGGAQ